MRRFSQKIYWLATVLLTLPVRVSAQRADIDPDEFVPVPFLSAGLGGGLGGSIIDFFFIAGPAGAFTASGLVLGIVNILLAIVGLISVLFLLWGGFRYITSRGNEEEAEIGKRAIQNSIIGLVITILSFVIVRVIATALIYGIT